MLLVNTLSQIIMALRMEHYVEEKHVLGYFKVIVEYGLRYLGDIEVKLQGYTYLDWESSESNENSTSRCCFSSRSTKIF